MRICRWCVTPSTSATDAPCSHATKCESCGEWWVIGEFPLCPHGYPSSASTAPFAEYWDEHVAPPPSADFKPAPGVSLPEYHPDRGYRISNLGDRQKLMRLNRMDYRGLKNDNPRREL